MHLFSENDLTAAEHLTRFAISFVFVLVVIVIIIDIGFLVSIIKERKKAKANDGIIPTPPAPTPQLSAFQRWFQDFAVTTPNIEDQFTELVVRRRQWWRDTSKSYTYGFNHYDWRELKDKLKELAPQAVPELLEQAELGNRASFDTLHILLNIGRRKQLEANLASPEQWDSLVAHYIVNPTPWEFSKALRKQHPVKHNGDLRLFAVQAEDQQSLTLIKLALAYANYKTKRRHEIDPVTLKELARFVVRSQSVSSLVGSNTVSLTK
ncbi:MAG: hypothetical protein WAQ27_06485 [Candidatus Microsaccharimonas sp.]